MGNKALKLHITAIPQGTRTFLFEEAELKRKLEQEIFSRMRARNFQEIVTPLLEYFDTAGAGLSGEERDRIIRFAEEDSGRAIALRPDITSQIARSAATHLSGRPLPLRLCYSGPVFRRTRKGKGEQYVLNQAGIEILGSGDISADIEVISCITDLLESASLKGCALSLGHAGIVGAFMREVPPTWHERIKTALLKKDRASLKELAVECGLPERSAKGLVELGGMFGGREVFKEAEKLCKGDPAASASLAVLLGIFTAAERTGMDGRVTVDLGEIRGFGYYTGVIMELFSPGGLALGNGGRYDSLVKRFGADLPAVGFAFDIDRMIEAVMRESSGRKLEELLNRLGR